MNMIVIIQPRILFLLVLWVYHARAHIYHDAPYTLTDALLREVVAKMGEATNDYLELPSDNVVTDDESDRSRVPKEFDNDRQFQPDYDTLDTMIRDQEYLQHSSLWGHQYMAGKPTFVLPAYCNPPNPCPKGYTHEDGCLENFVNSAAFSRNYQAAQECMCDTEHMFDCPTSTRDSEISALAQSIQNEGVMSHALDKIMEEFDVAHNEHKNMVAKKHYQPEPRENFFHEFLKFRNEPTKVNPYLQGEKLPIVAKKAPKFM
uniref:Neuroendocrine protein 7B2 n=1 Tax=Strigamia maritima TaxID=126957 RepID=T1IPU4_STRMM